MAHVLAVATLRRVSNLPRDNVVNTFHFSTPTNPATQAEMNDVANRVRDFYAAVAPPSIENLGGSLGSQIATSGHTVKVYRMSDPKPRPVAAMVTFGLIVGSTTFPAEVALCLSFKGEEEAGANLARRRGRVYIGPLATSGGSINTTADAQPTATLIAKLINAGLALATPQLPGASEWHAYSQASSLLVPIRTLWVDHAFDTQRRRGAATNGRTIATVPGS